MPGDDDHLLVPLECAQFARHMYKVWHILLARKAVLVAMEQLALCQGETIQTLPDTAVNLQVTSASYFKC